MLYRFLSLYKTDVRVLVANRSDDSLLPILTFFVCNELIYNRFFAQCQHDKDRLLRLLLAYEVSRDPTGRFRSREDKIEQERQVLIRWLSRVGTFTALIPNSANAVGNAVEVRVPHAVVLDTLADTENEAAARARLRRALVNQEIEARFGGTRRYVIHVLYCLFDHYVAFDKADHEYVLQ